MNARPLSRAPFPLLLPVLLPMLALLTLLPPDDVLGGEQNATKALQAAAEHERDGRWRDAAEVLGIRRGTC